MLIALDSNIIIYAEGLIDDPRNEQARELIEAIPTLNLIVPVQAIGETLRWLIGRAKLPKATAIQRISKWTAHYETQATTLAVWQHARELISGHNFQVWDAVILAAAAESGAELLLSEDMQDGFKWRGVTVGNPFAEKPQNLVKDIWTQRT
jgi:predicted nucleic acid-binding protein